MEQSFHAFCVYRNPRLNFSNVATAQAASLQRVSLLKFEPKVSNFPVTESGLPVSVTTATGKVQSRVSVMFVSFFLFIYVLDVDINSSNDFQFLHAVTKKRQNHIKVSSTNIFCSESNGSQRWIPLQVKIETLGSIFSQETRKGYWQPHR